MPQQFFGSFGGTLLPRVSILGMDDVISLMRARLDTCGELVEVVLNAISLFFIVAGVIASLVQSIRNRYTRPESYPLHVYFRIKFGAWLVVALEFQLAADIVGTIISPTPGHLIELGAIAVIRTFLNYFLSKELNEEMKLSNSESQKTEP
ncbi:DUF1622 domain-containing protein [Flavihumibacter solisilvae]|nr:DUF1622 domain-containing protein [Flavihumibacter solisilvae]